MISDRGPITACVCARVRVRVHRCRVEVGDASGEHLVLLQADASWFRELFFFKNAIMDHMPTAYHQVRWGRGRFLLVKGTERSTPGQHACCFPPGCARASESKQACARRPLASYRAGARGGGLAPPWALGGEDKPTPRCASPERRRHAAPSRGFALWRGCPQALTKLIAAQRKEVKNRRLTRLLDGIIDPLQLSKQVRGGGRSASVGASWWDGAQPLRARCRVPRRQARQPLPRACAWELPPSGSLATSAVGHACPVVGGFLARAACRRRAPPRRAAAGPVPAGPGARLRWAWARRPPARTTSLPHGPGDQGRSRRAPLLHLARPTCP